LIFERKIEKKPKKKKSKIEDEEGEGIDLDVESDEDDEEEEDEYYDSAGFLTDDDEETDAMSSEARSFLNYLKNNATKKQRKANNTTSFDPPGPPPPPALPPLSDSSSEADECDNEMINLPSGLVVREDGLVAIIGSDDDFEITKKIKNEVHAEESSDAEFDAYVHLFETPPRNDLLSRNDPPAKEVPREEKKSRNDTPEEKIKFEMTRNDEIPSGKELESARESGPEETRPVFRAQPEEYKGDIRFFTICGSLCRYITSPLLELTLCLQKKANSDMWEVKYIEDVDIPNIVSIGLIKSVLGTTRFYDKGDARNMKGDEDTPSEKKERSQIVRKRVKNGFFPLKADKITDRVPLDRGLAGRCPDEKIQHILRNVFESPGFFKKITMFEHPNPAEHSDAFDNIDLDKLDNNIIFENACFSCEPRREYWNEQTDLTPKKRVILEAAYVFHDLKRNSKRYGHTISTEKTIGAWSQELKAIFRGRKELVLETFASQKNYIKEKAVFDIEHRLAATLLKIDNLKVYTIGNDESVNYTELLNDVYKEYCILLESMRNDTNEEIIAIKKELLAIKNRSPLYKKEEREELFNEFSLKKIRGEDLEKKLKEISNQCIIISPSEARRKYVGVSFGRSHTFISGKNIKGPVRQFEYAKLVIFDRAHSYSLLEFEKMLEQIINIYHPTTVVLCGSGEIGSVGTGQPFRDIIASDLFSSGLTRRPRVDIDDSYEFGKVTSFHDSFDEIPFPEYVNRTLVVHNSEEKRIVSSLHKGDMSIRVITQHEVKQDTAYDICTVLFLDKITYWNIHKVISCVPPRISNNLFYVIGRAEDFDLLIKEAKSKANKSSSFGEVLKSHFRGFVPYGKRE
jgi:hypothetical protein